VRSAPLAGVALAALLLTACSSDADLPEGDELTGVGWSPCDGLTAAKVSRIVGEPMEMQTGTTDQPRCTFTPVTEGGPAYDVSYLLFDGGLDEALDAMGAASTLLEPVAVPGAEAARIAVRERDSGTLVSGFVQTDGLVQSVNAVGLAPYDKDALVDTTTDLLAELAEQAPQQ